jgi:phage gp36-like protein
MGRRHHDPMTYATPSDLVERYPERDLRHMTDPDGQAFDGERAQKALEDASEEIDVYLGRRYLLPLQDLEGNALIDLPKMLVRATCDLAVYRLQTLRPADDVKDARQRYEDVLRALKQLASGDISFAGVKLRPDVSDVPSPTAVGSVQFASAESLFGRGVR